MKSLEIYGFVGWITTFVAYFFFLIWSILPKKVMQNYGINFYPDREWALALPSLFIMTILFVLMIYAVLNMSITLSPESYHTLQGFSVSLTNSR
jgi:phosphatidylinositol glycan class P protein